VCRLNRLTIDRAPPVNQSAVSNTVIDDHSRAHDDETKETVGAAQRS